MRQFEDHILFDVGKSSRLLADLLAVRHFVPFPPTLPAPPRPHLTRLLCAASESCRVVGGFGAVEVSEESRTAVMVDEAADALG